MAKSHLNLNGAKREKLELDYLRLVYTVKDLRAQGESAQGYLVVLDEDLASRARRWESSYKAQECVTVVLAHLPEQVMEKVKDEKRKNRAGMVSGATGAKAGGRSSTTFSKATAEDVLRTKICELEPNVEAVDDKKKFPCGIRWDFYGVVKG
jgi:hypothetical protein